MNSPQEKKENSSLALFRVFEDFLEVGQLYSASYPFFIQLEDGQDIISNKIFGAPKPIGTLSPDDVFLLLEFELWRHRKRFTGEITGDVRFRVYSFHFKTIITFFCL